MTPREAIDKLQRAGVRIVIKKGEVTLCGRRSAVREWAPLIAPLKDALLVLGEEMPPLAGEESGGLVPPPAEQTTTTGTDTAKRQTHCPAYPKTGIYAGASWEWCQENRGKMDACETCPWASRKNEIEPQA